MPARGPNGEGVVLSGRDEEITMRWTESGGLEPLTIAPHSNFINVGERTNVTGSARFRRLITEGDYETARLAVISPPAELA